MSQDDIILPNHEHKNLVYYLKKFSLYQYYNYYLLVRYIAGIYKYKHIEE